jgi:hypothetical protein
LSGAASGSGSGSAIVVGDDFSDSRRAGSVVGSHASHGFVRKGIDREGVIGIDTGAARIQPLEVPGWQRAGLAYGPFERRSGRAFAVFMLNGHNTAQAENLTETFRSRIGRWRRGPETSGQVRRLLEWLSSNRKARVLRQMRWWFRTREGGAPVPRVDENLAIGWFPDEVPRDPLAEGHGLVMHATGAENGELWARVGGAMLPAVRGVQNLQTYYVVVLRDRGAAYYAASVPGANGLGTYPNLRPLAIDATGTDPVLHGGVFQSTLGQIGFRLDTRIYGVRVADVPQWAAWYGTAHAADRLDTGEVVSGAIADVGGTWLQYSAWRGATGDVADEGCHMVLRPAAPSGLVHVVIDPEVRDSVGLVWRHVDESNHWVVTIGSAGAELSACINGQRSTVARDERPLAAGRSQSLQVIDEGHRFSVVLEGHLLFGKRFADDRLQAAAGVGVAVPIGSQDGRLRRFEAHPRECALPHSLDQGSPWSRTGRQVVVTEDFDGPARDLSGKQTTTGGKTWQQLLGSGRIDLTGRGSAKVRASVAQPSPGRHACTVDWDHPEFADLEVEITPPGTKRGEGENGRSGFILWQDPDNYVVLNIWCADVYPGASTSTFFRLDGCEDLYDAVWSNVGDHIQWGRPVRLRIAFDGMHYTVFVGDEPVLYRALTDVYPDAKRLRIRRVGLLSNWEWGTDTGSEFRCFRARA